MVTLLLFPLPVEAYRSCPSRIISFLGGARPRDCRSLRLRFPPRKRWSYSETQLSCTGYKAFTQDIMLVKNALLRCDVFFEMSQCKCTFEAFTSNDYAINHRNGASGVTRHALGPHRLKKLELPLIGRVCRQFRSEHLQLPFSTAFLILRLISHW